MHNDISRTPDGDKVEVFEIVFAYLFTHKLSSSLSGIHSLNSIYSRLKPELYANENVQRGKMALQVLLRLHLLATAVGNVATENQDLRKDNEEDEESES